MSLDGSKSGLGVSDEVIKAMNLKLMPAGTVVASCSASLGTYAIASRPLVTNQTFIGLVCGDRMYNRFLLHVMHTKTDELRAASTTGTIAYVSRKKFEDLRVPVPPLEVQRETVRILDQFTELEAKLEAELEAELEARSKQYAHYAMTILEHAGQSASSHELGQLITHLRTGLNPRKNFELNPPGARGYYATVRELNGFGLRFTEKTDRLDEAGLNAINNRSRLRVGDVLFSATGTIGRTALVEEDPIDWNIKEGVYALTPDPEVLDSRYFIYLLRSMPVHGEIMSRAAGSTVQSIPMAELRKVSLKVPPLEVQRDAVQALDKFNALVNDLSIGLPAELAARRKQYEYYRDKLLTFEEAPA